MGRPRTTAARTCTLWFYPQLQLRGTFLGMWSVVLPDLPDDEVRGAGQQVARAPG